MKHRSMKHRSKSRRFWLSLWLLGAPILGHVAPVHAAPSRWESEILAFETADKQQFPPPDAALFIGSSSIRLWENLASDFAEIPTIRRGFGGSHLSDSTSYFERIVAPYQPRIVVLYAGSNDLATGKTPAQVFADFREFHAKLKATLPQTRLIYVSINPTTARWKLRDKTGELNRLVEEFTRQQTGISFLDTYPAFLGPDGLPQKELLRADGLHLNAQGYKKWLERLKPPILKFYADAAPKK